MADFQASIGEFESEGVKVIAASVDPLEKARETIEAVGITYPVGYGMKVEEVSKITGALYDREKKFLHATGYLVRPDKTIAVACYSSGPIGRLVAEDVLKVVRFYKAKK